jgi:hypothetical protein
MTAVSRVLAQVRPGSAVRGAGVALACLSPGLLGRARALAAAYVVGWPLDKPGLQFFTIVPDEDEDPWKRTVVPIVTSGASWTAVMLTASSAIRRSRIPTPVAALLLGGVVALGDTLAADMFGRMKAKAQAAAAERDAEEPATC